MQMAKAKGRLRGKQPRLKPNQAKHLLELHDLGTYSGLELAELFGVGRSTIYRTIERMRPKPLKPERPHSLLAPRCSEGSRRCGRGSDDPARQFS
jgi:transposase